MIDSSQFLGGGNLDHISSLVLLDPADDAIVSRQRQNKLSAFIRGEGVRRGFRFPFHIAISHIQPLAVALIARVCRKSLKVSGLHAVHHRDAMAVFIDGHGQVNRSIFLPEGAHIRLPCADKAKIIQLRKSFRRMRGVIHVFQAEQGNDLADRLFV